MLGWRPIAALDDIQAAREQTRSPETSPSRRPAPHRQDAPPAPDRRPHGLQLLAERGAVEDPPDARTRLRYLLRRATTRTETFAADNPAESPPGPEAPSGTDGVDLYDPPPTEAPQMAKYLSRQWVEAGRKTVENDPRFKRHTEGISASILCIIEEQPAHADEVFYIDFADGHIRELYSGPRQEFEKRHAAPTFAVYGDYETFREIQTGDLSQSTALMRGRLRLKGSLLKALKYMKALDSVTDILRETPTEY